MRHIFAALTFFTRLPFWRLGSVDVRYYKEVVPYWPYAGWLTGGIMCLVLWLASHLMPPFAAILAALLSRVLVTGALHEDGLADFCDGMGGGSDRTRTLAIMKDSHTGSYGIISLIFYFMLASSLLLAFPTGVACCVIFAGDAWSKLCSSQIINFLPYARTENEAKNRLVYNRMTRGQLAAAIIGGALPLLYMPVALLGAALFPAATVACLMLLMHRRINGYTGDCCGAAFLISELTFYLGAVILYRL